MTTSLGRRILVTGMSCAGKSTLAGQIAALLEVPHVEMDALNWQPGWVALCVENPEQFERKLAAATAGDGWVTDGSYRKHSEVVVWPRLDAVVWLDLPLRVLVWRCLVRSWRRWRSQELLWGTNRESFWIQFKIWSDESLLGYILGHYKARRIQLATDVGDERWSHIRFVHLKSLDEVQLLLAQLRAELAGEAARLV